MHHVVVYVAVLCATTTRAASASKTPQTDALELEKLVSKQLAGKNEDASAESKDIDDLVKWAMSKTKYSAMPAFKDYVPPTPPTPRPTPGPTTENVQDMKKLVDQQLSGNKNDVDDLVKWAMSKTKYSSLGEFSGYDAKHAPTWAPTAEAEVALEKLINKKLDSEHEDSKFKAEEVGDLMKWAETQYTGKPTRRPTSGPTAEQAEDLENLVDQQLAGKKDDVDDLVKWAMSKAKYNSLGEYSEYDPRESPTWQPTPPPSPRATMLRHRQGSSKVHVHLHSALNCGTRTACHSCVDHMTDVQSCVWRLDTHKCETRKALAAENGLALSDAVFSRQDSHWVHDPAMCKSASAGPERPQIGESMIETFANKNAKSLERMIDKKVSSEHEDPKLRAEEIDDLLQWAEAKTKRNALPHATMNPTMVDVVGLENSVLDFEESSSKEEETDVLIDLAKWAKGEREKFSPYDTPRPTATPTRTPTHYTRTLRPTRYPTTRHTAKPTPRPSRSPTPAPSAKHGHGPKHGHGHGPKDGHGRYEHAHGRHVRPHGHRHALPPAPVPVPTVRPTAHAHAHAHAHANAHRLAGRQPAGRSHSHIHAASTNAATDGSSSSASTDASISSFLHSGGSFLHRHAREAGGLVVLFALVVVGFVASTQPVPKIWLSQRDAALYGNKQENLAAKPEFVGLFNSIKSELYDPVFGTAKDSKTDADISETNGLLSEDSEDSNSIFKQQVLTKEEKARLYLGS